MRLILASLHTTENIMDKNDQNANTKPTIVNHETDLPSDQSNTNNSGMVDFAGEQVPTISILVHSAIKPHITNNIFDCFDSTNPIRTFWI